MYNIVILSITLLHFLNIIVISAVASYGFNGLGALAHEILGSIMLCYITFSVPIY